MISIRILCIVTLIFGSVITVAAQTSPKLSKSMYIQAQAVGSGPTFGVTAVIDRYSTPEDQETLLQAFQTGGNEAVVSELSNMSSKGRLAITGSLGDDVAYIHSFQQPDGSTVIRILTNRPLPFRQAFSGNRMPYYRLTALEVILSKDGKHNKGTLYPGAELKVDKEGQLEFEAYQNPWRLVEIELR